MPGLFSGITKAARSVGGAGSRFAGSMGAIGVGAARGRYGGTAAGMMYGGAAGGLYGAVSGDTSVVGGALGGALMGGAIGRYGGAGMKGYSRAMNPAARGMPRAPVGQALRRGGRAALGQLKGDALLASNKAVNGFSTLRNRLARTGT